jgi:hypothetical protein
LKVHAELGGAGGTGGDGGGGGEGRPQPVSFICEVTNEALNSVRSFIMLANLDGREVDGEGSRVRWILLGTKTPKKEETGRARKRQLKVNGR